MGGRQQLKPHRGGSKEDEGGELAGEDVSQRLHPEGEVLDEVIVSRNHTNHKIAYTGAPGYKMWDRMPLGLLPPK